MGLPQVWLNGNSIGGLQKPNFIAARPATLIIKS